ncbi:glycosyltransferase family 2 protein [Deltaproteobacteria bacterium]|nr:glycosyltransferase family 2 protein [Deltaproteobacteria bacterium]
MKVLVLLPTLDEEEALPQVLASIPNGDLSSKGVEIGIMIVDGGSTDSTLDIARKAGCTIVEQKTTGKGLGLRLGFEVFLSSDYDRLVMFDADATYDPADITKMLEKLDQGSDIVIGSRLRGRMDPDAMSQLNYLGNNILTWIAVCLYGAEVSDICSGFWAFEKKAIATLNLNSISFEIEAEMYASAALAGLVIGHVPISYGIRLGEPKLGSLHDGTRILRKLVTRRFLQQVVK